MQEQSGFKTSILIPLSRYQQLLKKHQNPSSSRVPSPQKLKRRKLSSNDTTSSSTDGNASEVSENEKKSRVDEASRVQFNSAAVLCSGDKEAQLARKLMHTIKSSFSKAVRGGRVVRRCWVNFQCWGVLPTWIIVGQGPIVLAVGAGGGCLDIFSLIYPFSFLSPPLWETARYRLKYCLKGPLSPKQPTNQSKAVREKITRLLLFILNFGSHVLTINQNGNQNGNVLIRNRIVDPASNIVDLLRASVSATVPKPVGFKEFRKALTEINVPQSFLLAGDDDGGRGNIDAILTSVKKANRARIKKMGNFIKTLTRLLKKCYLHKSTKRDNKHSTSISKYHVVLFIIFLLFFLLIFQVILYHANKAPGDGRVERRCWVNLQYLGVLLVWMIVGQGPIALAVGAGGGSLDFFSLIYLFSFLSGGGRVVRRCWVNFQRQGVLQF